MLGVNREAAILLEGTDDEQPFQNAVKHLESCRDEAIPFDPNHPPPPLDPQPTLIIHAESHTTLQAPPWFVHFRPSTTLYDKLMRPPSPVWLFLYPPQSLTPARTRPIPQAAYSGTITALNFTEHHPTKGTPASWTQAPYIIEDQGGVFAVTQSRPATKTPTQGVFSIQAEEPASTLWLSENPAAKMEKTVSEERIEDLEPKFQRFFTTRSLRNGRLVIREYDDMKPAYRFPDKEIGMAGTAELAERLKMPRDARVDLRKSRRDDFLFVYRAKYKV
jgi:hypothetical protein